MANSHCIAMRESWQLCNFTGTKTSSAAFFFVTIAKYTVAKHPPGGTVSFYPFAELPSMQCIQSAAHISAILSKYLVEISRRHVYRRVVHGACSLFVECVSFSQATAAFYLSPFMFYTQQVHITGEKPNDTHRAPHKSQSTC